MQEGIGYVKKYVYIYGVKICSTNLMLLVFLNYNLLFKPNRLMRKMYYFIGAFVLASCSQEVPIEISDLSIGESDEFQEEFHISRDEAIDIALESMRGFEYETRSKSRKVSSVRMFSPVKGGIASYTRSSQTEGSVDYYIINFEDNKGFAVVSNDNRVRPLRAISPEGKLDMTDTIENKGLAAFFTSLPPVNPDSIYVIGTNPNFPGRPNTPEYKLLVSPLLDRSVQTWSQGYPYNYYCNGSPVGCTALSCAQVMSFMEWPLSYDGVRFNWKEIKLNPYSDGLAKLLAQLGQPQNLAMMYGENASGAYFENTVRTFRNLGYKEPILSKFSIATAIDYLMAGQPLIMQGRSNNQPGAGHAWVIDGLYYVKGVDMVVSPGQKQEPHYYPHCVWGYGGRSNGYFDVSDMTIGKTKVHTEDYEDGNVLSGYYYDLHMVYNFEKN